jgi:probable DNA repair protein
VLTIGLAAGAEAAPAILAPNTELAAALFDAAERRHVQAGDTIWPTPHIREFGGWLRERYGVMQGTDAALPRLLSDIEERELWREVVLESEFALEFLAPDGAARSARRARRAMCDYGIPEHALAEHATEETQALLDWSRRFDARCRGLNCIASDRLLALTARLATAAPDPSWIESPIWRPEARRWLEQQGATPILPARRGVQAPPSVFRAASPELELAAIADWAQANLRSNGDFRAWICVPDLTARRHAVQDALDAALAPRRFALGRAESAAPYAIAGGTPLAEYAPVRAALCVLAAMSGRLSFAIFSSLLRMPDLQASIADAAAAARLDLALRTRGPDEATIADWLRVSVEVCSAVAAESITALKRLQDSQRILAAVRGRQVLSRWVAHWVQAFEAGPWASRNHWSSAEFQSAERFRELLAALATCDEVFGPRSSESAAGILLRAARDTAFQPQTGIPPIWVSGELMDPWLGYDGLWVTGCGEDRWPPPPDPIALLPIRVQRDYGVVAAGADSQLQFALDLQQRWQARSGRCVFSCADAGEGRASSLSPLLPQMRVQIEPGAPPRRHWNALAERPPQLQTLLDEAAPPFTTDERTRGVATLRAQSQCAFRGFAETRLATQPLLRPVPGFNVRERGELLHRALEHLWSELRSSERLRSLTVEERDRLIQSSVGRSLDTQCRRRNPGPRWRDREGVRMAALLHVWLKVELEREPFEVADLEPGTDSAQFGGIQYRVRIDRIDRLRSGETVLIDYKSGTPGADWRGDRPENPQLPVYAVMRPARLVAVAYGRVNARDCGFVAEAARGQIFKPTSRKSELEGMPDFASLVALWSRRIEKIAAEFATGYAAVAPTARACATCRLQPLCRIQTIADQDSDE